MNDMSIYRNEEFVLKGTPTQPTLFSISLAKNADVYASLVGNDYYQMAKEFSKGATEFLEVCPDLRKCFPDQLRKFLEPLQGNSYDDLLKGVTKESEGIKFEICRMRDTDDPTMFKSYEAKEAYKRLDKENRVVFHYIVIHTDIVNIVQLNSFHCPSENAERTFLLDLDDVVTSLSNVIQADLDTRASVIQKNIGLIRNFAEDPNKYIKRYKLQRQIVEEAKEHLRRLHSLIQKDGIAWTKWKEETEAFDWKMTQLRLELNTLPNKETAK